MDLIGSVLVFLKDSVLFIIKELKQLERMNMFISTNILTYEVAINNLLETIQMLNNPIYSNIVNRSSICSILSLIQSHVLSLNKLVIRINKWNNDVKKGGFKKVKALIQNRPSLLSQELFSKLLEIKPLLMEIEKLEKETLGSGVRINNPLLRAAWVLAGSNQINDSSLDKNIIIENIYLLLKSELGGEIKNPPLWKTAINNFVNAIDGCAASLSDGKLSISEMNEFTIPSDKTTFKLLLKDYLEVNKVLLLTDKVSSSNINSPSKITSSNDRHSGSTKRHFLSNNDSPLKRTSSSDGYASNSIENSSGDSPSKFTTSTDEYQSNSSSSDKNSSNSNDSNPSKLITISNSTSEKNSISSSDHIDSNSNHDETTSNSSDDIIHDDKLGEYKINIPIHFTSKIIRYTSTVQIPKCSGYGSNWPSTLLCTFTIPNSNEDGDELNYIDVFISANDQGWGDTGHANIRYQINDNPITLGFFIHRTKCPDGQYKLTLNWEKVKVGDRVNLWLCCPTYSGWAAKVDSVDIYAIYNRLVIT